MNTLYITLARTLAQLQERTDKRRGLSLVIDLKHHRAIIDHWLGQRRQDVGAAALWASAVEPRKAVLSHCTWRCCTVCVYIFAEDLKDVKARRRHRVSLQNDRMMTEWWIMINHVILEEVFKCIQYVILIMRPVLFLFLNSESVHWVLAQ